VIVELGKRIVSDLRGRRRRASRLGEL